MILSSQVRAAKALLRWSGEDYVIKARLSLSLIRLVDSSNGIPEAENIKTIIAIKKALEEAGIEFIVSPDDKPGVRLK